jgi:formate dehydrogenase alpha subunit
MRNVLTVCPYCGCGCGLYLKIEGNKSRGVMPSKEHPISRGQLCIKGWNVHPFISNSQRLQRPLVRADRPGTFRESDWDGAYNIFNEKFKEIQEKYGRNSIGIIGSAKCTNEESFLLMKFARSVLGTNNIDNCVRLCHAPTLRGLSDSFGLGAMTNSINEIENAEVILVVGSNTTEEHPLVGNRVLKALDHGAKLIVVDPRRTQIAKMSRLHLQPRPGTDLIWINSLMRIIIEENLSDLEFVSQRTENFEVVKEIVKKFTPEYVESMTGLALPDLRETAKTYSRSRASMIIYGMGITQHGNGTDTVRALANLVLLTGNIGREKSGIIPLLGQSNMQGACDMGVLPDYYSGYQSIEYSRNVAKFEKAWKRKLPIDKGLTFMEMIKKARQGKIKAMYIVGENVLLSAPNIHEVQEALSRLEFLAVQDMFLTETAQLAHLVLPSASFAEKDGTLTSTERRVQLTRKCVEPLGETKPDWQIFCELAGQAGYREMNYRNPEKIMEEIAFLTPIYEGLSYGKLDNAGGIQWPADGNNPTGTKFLYEDSFPRGSGHFAPVLFTPGSETPDQEYPYFLLAGKSGYYFHTGSLTRKSPALEREFPNGFVEINPNDAERLRVKSGWKVKIVSKYGELFATVSVTTDVPEKVVFLPFHFKEGAANSLLGDSGLDPKSKIPEFKLCAVKIIST